MENMIKRIMELDRIEQQLTADAEKQKRETENNIENTKRAVKNDFLQRARQRIATNTAVEEESADRKREEAEARAERDAKRLDDIAAQNMDKWVDEIVDAVIKQA